MRTIYFDITSGDSSLNQVLQLVNYDSLDRIHLFHDALDSCVEQNDLVVQLVVNLLCKLLAAHFSVVKVIHHLHVNEQVAELGLCRSHIVLRNLFSFHGCNVLMHLLLECIVVLLTMLDFILVLFVVGFTFFPVVNLINDRSI